MPGLECTETDLHECPGHDGLVPSRIALNSEALLRTAGLPQRSGWYNSRNPTTWPDSPRMTGTRPTGQQSQSEVTPSLALLSFVRPLRQQLAMGGGSTALGARAYR